MSVLLAKASLRIVGNGERTLNTTAILLFYNWVQNAELPLRLPLSNPLSQHSVVTRTSVPTRYHPGWKRPVWGWGPGAGWGCGITTMTGTLPTRQRECLAPRRRPSLFQVLVLGQIIRQEDLSRESPYLIHLCKWNDQYQNGIQLAPIIHGCCLSLLGGICFKLSVQHVVLVSKYFEPLLITCWNPLIILHTCYFDPLPYYITCMLLLVAGM